MAAYHGILSWPQNRQCLAVVEIILMQEYQSINRQVHLLLSVALDYMQNSAFEINEQWRVNADDTKLCKNVENLEDVLALQRDLKSLQGWATDWQMSFNVNKSAVMHLDHNNRCSRYKVGNTDLKSTVKKKISCSYGNTLKFSEQCSTAMKCANCTLCLIKKIIKSRSNDIIVNLYRALIRPKLEYCEQAWRPFLRKDINSMERVQTRAT